MGPFLVIIVTRLAPNSHYSKVLCYDNGTFETLLSTFSLKLKLSQFVGVGTFLSDKTVKSWETITPIPKLRPISI